MKNMNKKLLNYNNVFVSPIITSVRRNSPFSLLIRSQIPALSKKNLATLSDRKGSSSHILYTNFLCSQNESYVINGITIPLRHIIFLIMNRTTRKGI